MCVMEYGLFGRTVKVVKDLTNTKAPTQSKEEGENKYSIYPSSRIWIGAFRLNLSCF